MWSSQLEVVLLSNAFEYGAVWRPRLRTCLRMVCEHGLRNRDGGAVPYTYLYFKALHVPGLSNSLCIGKC